MWAQRQMRLPPMPRGLHLITHHVIEALPELADFRVGLLHVQILHTSASLTINENASSDVRVDLEHALNRLAPEDDPGYTHTDEGPDDMPAHIKASLFGPSVTVPVNSGRLVLGTWQGIQLAEHRDHGGPRSLVLTLNGE
ncbi:MAG: YjbQ family protein [Solirubrobacteraceae bacterium]|nr:YjbQ family protein [Solirubrobacteraceae bacterium]